MLQGHLLYYLFSDSACMKEAWEEEQWQNETCLLIVLFSARLHGAHTYTHQHWSDKEKSTFTLAHIHCQTVALSGRFSSCVPPVRRKKPLTLNINTHTCSLCIYYLHSNTFLCHYLCLFRHHTLTDTHLHTYTICLPDSRPMHAHRGTFANGTKLQAITLDLGCKKGPKSPEFSNLSFDLAKRHIPAAASVLCNP